MVTNKKLNEVANSILKQLGFRYYNDNAKRKLSEMYNTDFFSVDKKDLLQALIKDCVDYPYQIKGCNLCLNNLVIEENVSFPFLDLVPASSVYFHTPDKKLPNSVFWCYGYEEVLFSELCKSGVKLIRLAQNHSSYRYPYDKDPNPTHGLVCDCLWVRNAIGEAMGRNKPHKMIVQFDESEMVLSWNEARTLYNKLKTYDSYVCTDTSPRLRLIMKALGYNVIYPEKVKGTILERIHSTEDKPILVDGYVYKNGYPYLPDTCEDVQGMLGINDLSDCLRLKYVNDSSSYTEYRWDLNRRSLWYASTINSSMKPYAKDLPEFEMDAIILWLLLHDPEADTRFNIHTDINLYAAYGKTPYSNPVKAAIYNAATLAKHYSTSDACGLAETDSKLRRDLSSDWTFVNFRTILKVDRR